MTALDRAIEMFGFENPITVTVALLEEQGKARLAGQLIDAIVEVVNEDIE
jgi:hypothetical protein